MKNRINAQVARLRGLSAPRVSFIALISAPALAGALLLLSAIPALADGGPHQSLVNSGSSTLTADSCAGCHRAHTAQGESLLAAQNEEALCLSCHGSGGTGATTDVEWGIQYVPSSSNARTTVVLGALRNGGFLNAAIDSANPARRLVSNTLSASDDQQAKVRVRVDGTGVIDPAPVTSAHLNLPASGLSAPTIAWGNGALGSGAGPVVSLTCSSCHNPHGNGLYRILNPVPAADGAGFVNAAASVSITDSPVDNPDPAESDTKNYTVIQERGTPGTDSTYLLYADDVLDKGYGPATGDYWHVRVPWNAASTSTNGSDAPNGIPANRLVGSTLLTAFDAQITDWCSTCHTRYKSAAGDVFSGDPVFGFSHETTGNRACTTCHVSHGSNARMDGPFSAAQPFPNGDTLTYDIGGVTGDSRLLKVDGRGTCQLCHDPTGTVANGTYTGPLPTPGVP